MKKLFLPPSGNVSLIEFWFQRVKVLVVCYGWASHLPPRTTCLSRHKNVTTEMLNTAVEIFNLIFTRDKIYKKVINIVIYLEYYRENLLLI